MKRFFLLAALLSMTLIPMSAQNHAQQVIAHRGYWKTEGSAQNSISSLRNSHAIKIYGSEFDVHITRDGKLIVHHDNDVDGILIEDAKYSDIKNKHLANGEKLPTLKMYLKAAKKLSDLKLILEIKKHKQKADEERCVKTVLKTVKSMGLEQRTEYISFSRYICDYIVAHEPQAKISYLNGDITPDEAKKSGYTGIDYRDKVYDAHPSWISEAKKLGLTTNVWTVNKLEDIKKFFDEGIDFITTNEPLKARDL